MNNEIKKFVLASQNKHKASEIKNILGNKYEILTMNEVGLENFEVIEDGKTFEENAAKKAVQVYEKVRIPTIADDSGLCVDALNEDPGIFTARFAGENATDDDNIDKLLSELDGLEMNKRSAKFICVIAYIESDNVDDVKIFRGECSGYILNERHGINGFGYDPIFYYPEYKLSLAELGNERKNLISHRYNALKKFAEKI